MPTDSGASRAIRSRRCLLLVLLLTGIYAAGYLLWFWGTPLGQVLVLDGRENVILARQIAEGSLPGEPFFRAMLYPAVLSIAALAGFDDSAMLMAAGVLGVFAHLAGTAAVFGIALLLWKNARPAFLSALLFGLYPPAIYFASEPLDTTFSLTLLLVSLYFAVAANAGAERPKDFAKLAGSGFCAALAFIARPNFLPVLLALVIACAFARHSARSRMLGALTTIAAMLPVLAGYGAWQHAVSGQFGIMPWQGGYSLWVANGPEANGRYYAQKSLLSYEGPHQNPARVESEALYREETNGAPATPALIDRYWRDKTKAAILAAPGRWAELELKKLYFFLNDFEQYNNKTFSFHRERSPWLRWNPLSWGVVFCLAAAGLVAVWRADRRIALALALAAGAYLAGGLLVFAGDRFRFPLAPLAAIFAGGTAVFVLGPSTARQRAAALGAAALAAAIAFSRFAGAHDTSTYVQDRILLANAALRAGLDAEAEAHALEVLQEYPEREDARHIAAGARFNQHLAGTRPILAREEWKELAEQLGGASQTQRIQWTRAIAQWNAGREEEALGQWRKLATVDSSRVAADSLAMLIMSGRATAEEIARLAQLDWEQQSPYVWVARANLEGSPFELLAASRLGSDRWAKIKQTANRLVAPSVDR